MDFLSGMMQTAIQAALGPEGQQKVEDLMKAFTVGVDEMRRDIAATKVQQDNIMDTLGRISAALRIPPATEAPEAQPVQETSN